MMESITVPKALSKTVHNRQLKRLRPQHYEIITRYIHGQRLWKISSDMGISQPWLSVVINSPLVQREMESRYKEREKEVVEKLTHRYSRMLDGMEDTLRTGVESPITREDREFFWELENSSKVRKEPTPSKPGLGELVIKSIPRKAPPWMENSLTVEEPTEEPLPVVSPLESREPLVDSPKEPLIRLEETHPPSPPTSHLQCARFYSKVLRDWLWLALPYPGERLAYYEATQILRLSKGTPWRTYPEPFTPLDGHPCYSTEEIYQLRG